MKKYELTDKTKMINDSTVVCRIKALKSFADVKAGELGGWVESEDNLSQEGNCWIYDKSMAFDNARVLDNARVMGGSAVYDNAIVKDNALVDDHANVFGNAIISDYGSVQGYDNEVCGNAQIRGLATLGGMCNILGSDEILEKDEYKGSFYDEPKSDREELRKEFVIYRNEKTKKELMDYDKKLKNEYGDILKKYPEWEAEIEKDNVENIVTAPETVLRCNKCRYFCINETNNKKWCRRTKNYFETTENDFCSRAERK